MLRRGVEPSIAFVACVFLAVGPALARPHPPFGGALATALMMGVGAAAAGLLRRVVAVARFPPLTTSGAALVLLALPAALSPLAGGFAMGLVTALLEDARARTSAAALAGAAVGALASYALPAWGIWVGAGGAFVVGCIVVGFAVARRDLSRAAPALSAAPPLRSLGVTAIAGAVVGALVAPLVALATALAADAAAPLAATFAASALAPRSAALTTAEHGAAAPARAIAASALATALTLPLWSRAANGYALLATTLPTTADRNLVLLVLVAALLALPIHWSASAAFALGRPHPLALGATVLGGAAGATLANALCGAATPSRAAAAAVVAAAVSSPVLAWRARGRARVLVACAVSLLLALVWMAR